MPRLIPENSFTYIEKKATTFIVPVIPDNWLECFLDIWAIECELSDTDKHMLLGHINRHFGASSSYTHRKELTASMQNIYLHISNQTPRLFSKTEKIQLFEIIRTDISECTPGFHNRVNDTEKLLHLSFSLDEIRQSDKNLFIDEFARKISSDVHDHNKIFIIASKRFGVKAPNEKDPHVDLNYNLSTSNVLEILDAHIQCHYQPLQLITRLTQKIEYLLSEHYQYAGFIESGYSALVYQNIFNYLKTIFSSYELKMDEIFITNDDCLILDINFYQIQFFIYQSLKENKIIEITDAEEAALINHLHGLDYDYSYCSTLFNNHYELIAFLDLYRGKNIDLSYKILKSYMEGLTKEKINSIVFDLIIYNSPSSMLLFSLLPKLNSELQFINSCADLNEENKTVLIVSATHQLNIEATLKFISLLPQQELKRLLWITTVDNDEHVLFIACKKNYHTAKQFIEGIFKLTDIDTMYCLFRHTNYQNESILSIALLNRNGCYQSIFQVMSLFTQAQNENIIRYKDNFGYNLLMQAIRGKQGILNAFLEFVEIHAPSVFPELLSSTSLNGLNSLTFTILYHPYAFQRIIELVGKQDILTIEKILSQNNQHGDNCFFISAVEKISCLGALLAVLEKLPRDVQVDILKKKSKKNFTLLDVITDAREADIELFLQFISKHHSGLLYYYLSHNVNPLGTPLAGLLEDNSPYVEQLFKFIHQLTPDTQFRILTALNPEEISPLLLAFQNAPNYAYLIYSELIKHYPVKKDILIEYIHHQTLRLSQKPREFSLFLECLLLTADEMNTEIISKYLARSLKSMNVIYTKTLIESFIVLIHKQFNATRLNQFLEILIDTAARSGEDNIEIVISVILEKFEKTPSLINIKYVPYLLDLMKITRFQNTNTVEMIIDFVEKQSGGWKKVFFTSSADEVKNSILSVMIGENFEHFHCLFNCIIKLSLNDQISIMSHLNYRGKNFLHIAYERLADNPMLSMQFETMFDLLEKLNTKILKKILYTPTNNLLALAIQSHPQSVHLYLKLFDKFTKPNRLLRLLLIHQNTNGWSPLFLALKANKSHQVFSTVIKVIGKLELSDQMHLFSQICFEKVTLLFEVKHIERDFLSLLLSYASVEEFRQALDIINKMPMTNQKELVMQCVTDKFITSNQENMKIYETYKEKLESGLGKRLLKEDLSTRKSAHR